MSATEKTARERLRAREHQLDDTTLAALADARRRALAEHSHRPSWRYVAPALAGAAALLLAVFLWLPHENPDQGEDDTRVTETVEFYQDMDFYYWLSENDKLIKG